MTKLVEFSETYNDTRSRGNDKVELMTLSISISDVELMI
jgi:hypothetical protein